jgi:hypothetical protein
MTVVMQDDGVVSGMRSGYRGNPKTKLDVYLMQAYTLFIAER